MPFPHPILGHSNAIHILTLFAYDAHKKYDPPIYIPTAARRETGTWQAVTGILTSARARARTHTHTHAHTKVPAVSHNLKVSHDCAVFLWLCTPVPALTVPTMLSHE
jgi:hypothetical protein